MPLLLPETNRFSRHLTKVDLPDLLGPMMRMSTASMATSGVALVESFYSIFIVPC